jgi:hypothetical protein
MTEQMRSRLEQMTRAQKERRFEALQAKTNTAPAPATLRSDEWPEASLAEIEEREWLKKDLGYK